MSPYIPMSKDRGFTATFGNLKGAGYLYAGISHSPFSEGLRRNH